MAAKLATGEAKIAGSTEALLQLTSWIDRRAGSFPIVAR